MRKTLLIILIYWPCIVCHGQYSYAKADTNADRLYGFPLNNLKLLSDSLASGLADDCQKFRAIYRWVCTNISADYTLFTTQLRMREQMQDQPQKLAVWRRTFSRQVFRTLLDKRATLCSGYAYLVRELSYHAGIECEIVEGYGRTNAFDKRAKRLPNHAWVAVKLDGEWLFADPTWSAGRIDASTLEFHFEFSDEFFLVSPDEFVVNHYPLDTDWLLMDNAPTLDEFFAR